jgi:hypothetical protein
MPRNIRNTRRNFARPSDTTTLATSAAALSDVQGRIGSSISVTRKTGGLGPEGNGTYTVTSIPAGLSGSATTTATTATVAFSPSSTSAATYDIYVSDSNYNGAGKPTKVTNPITFPTPILASVLVIAGGAGGGQAFNGSQCCSGAGGAGGYREFTSYQLTTGFNYPVTVGAGGFGTQNGNNSIFSAVTANGGGWGANVTNSSADAGGTGGSGGGAGRGGGSQTNTGGAPIAITQFPGIELYTVQGFAGGNSSSSSAGGGGGASAVGGAGTSAGGAGGAGRASSITGTSVTRGGGGGGSSSGGGGAGSGGAGGGGQGGGNNSEGTNGTANTGGGAGGSMSNNTTFQGAYGGSGVVILRYPNTYTITIGAGLTGSTSTTGSDKVTTITAGTGNVSFA